MNYDKVLLVENFSSLKILYVSLINLKFFLEIQVYKRTYNVSKKPP